MVAYITFAHISLPQPYHTADLNINRWESYKEVNVFVNNNVTYERVIFLGGFFFFSKLKLGDLSSIGQHHYLGYLGVGEKSS